MTDYSPNPNGPFSRLRWNQVSILLSVLEDAGYTKAHHIERLYLERAENFQETFAFLSAVAGLSKSESDEIDFTLPAFSNEDHTKSWILDAIFSSQNVYCSDIYEYLQIFCIDGGEPRHYPKASTRHYQSHIRNFLIDMGIIEYNPNDDYYYIPPAHIDLYSTGCDIGRRVHSPATREVIQAEKESVGAAAEEFILGYERQRVGQQYKEKVRHISIVNDAAGYDIRSVTVETSELHIPRYIEVKAVPRISNRFYWSQNEISTSRKFGDWYYLYLLPVGRSGKFIIDELKVVQNPAEEILDRDDIWDVEPNVVQCRKRLRDIRGHSNEP